MELIIVHPPNSPLLLTQPYHCTWSDGSDLTTVLHPTSPLFLTRSYHCSSHNLTNVLHPTSQLFVCWVCSSSFSSAYTTQPCLFVTCERTVLLYIHTLYTLYAWYGILRRMRTFRKYNFEIWDPCCGCRPLLLKPNQPRSGRSSRIINSCTATPQLPHQRYQRHMQQLSIRRSSSRGSSSGTAAAAAAASSSSSSISSSSNSNNNFHLKNLGCRGSWLG